MGAVTVGAPDAGPHGRNGMGLFSYAPQVHGWDIHAVRHPCSMNRVASPRRQAAEPWTNPGRLGQYQADLAWLEDGQLDRLSQITSPCLPMAFEHDCWFPPRAVREAARRIPGCRHTELLGLGHGAPLLAAGQVNPALA